MTTVDLSADHRPIVDRLSADCQNPKTVGRWKNNYSKVVTFVRYGPDFEMKNCRAYWFRLVRQCVRACDRPFKDLKLAIFFYNFVVNSIQTRLPHPACFYFRITSIFGVHIYPTTPTPPPPSIFTNFFSSVQLLYFFIHI